MRISDKGLLFIAREEGVVLDAYRDSAGVWTIGIGHTASAGAPKPQAGMSISFNEAIELFRRDIAKYERRVTSFLAGKKVPQHVFDAMVSFDYNTGGGSKARWTKAVRDGDIKKAARLIMNWRKPASIIGRRKREQALLARGDYGDLSKITVYRATEHGHVLWGSARRVSTDGLFGQEKSVEPKHPRRRIGALETLIASLIAAAAAAVAWLEGVFK